MKLTYENRLDDLVLTPSSESTNYPITEALNPHLSNRYRSDSSLDINIVADNTMTPGMAFIAGHNLTSSATVKIQGNSTDVWTAPTVDLTMKREGDVYYLDEGFSSQNFWRFVIADPTNDATFITFGRIWIGDKIIFSGPSTVFSEKIINTSSLTVSISGQTYGDIGYSYRMYDMAYPLWDNTERENIKAFADYTNKSKPFFVVFDDCDSGNLPPMYSVQTKDLEFQHLNKLDIWAGKLTFMEVF